MVVKLKYKCLITLAPRGSDPYALSPEAGGERCRPAGRQLADEHGDENGANGDTESTVNDELKIYDIVACIWALISSHTFYSYSSTPVSGYPDFQARKMENRLPYVLISGLLTSPDIKF